MNFDFGNLRLSYSDIMQFARSHKLLIGSAVAIGLGVYGLRQHVAGGICRSAARLDGKTVIITGCNTGIGRETALGIAKRGARVILACRDITKAERAAAYIIKQSGNNDVVVRVLDLASLDSIRKFSKQMKETEPQLHVLINNAGVMACPKWETSDGFEMQLGTNHLGHFLLTAELLPLLKSSAPSRIVNVASAAHRRGKIHFDDLNLNEDQAYTPFRAYEQSKLANVLFTRELHRRLDGSGVTTYSLHPGVISTEIARYLPTWASVGFVVFGFFLKTVPQGAQTSIHCAIAEDIEKDSGKYFSDCTTQKVAPQGADDEVARRLWEVSERLVGLKA